VGDFLTLSPPSTPLDALPEGGERDGDNFLLDDGEGEENTENFLLDDGEGEENTENFLLDDGEGERDTEKFLLEVWDGDRDDGEGERDTENFLLEVGEGEREEGEGERDGENFLLKGGEGVRTMMLRPPVSSENSSSSTGESNPSMPCVEVTGRERARMSAVIAAGCWRYLKRWFITRRSSSRIATVTPALVPMIEMVGGRS
jgi:hypothetical protein